MTTSNAITPRTDAEWPPDHPLRRISSVITNQAAAVADVLVCSLVGEPRLPPAADDHDVVASCIECHKLIVHRASAPKLPPCCWFCWSTYR
jgi:hypothetical protein